MTRHHVLARFRTLALAALMAATSFAVTATPASAPAGGSDVLGQALSAITGSDVVAELGRGFRAAVAPKVAKAYCATDAAFTGRLTAASNKTAAVTRTKSALVYPYVSRVDTAFSCTAFYRYSGVAWNTTASGGRFDWGNLFNSITIPCNYTVGETTYVKANDTTDCPDTDAEYALPVTLSAERKYVQSANHNAVGDTSFVQTSCSTFYNDNNGERIRGAESGSGTRRASRARTSTTARATTARRSRSTASVPARASASPTTAPHRRSRSAPRGRRGRARRTSSTSYTLTFSITDAVAKFGAPSPGRSSARWPQPGRRQLRHVRRRHGCRLDRDRHRERVGPDLGADPRGRLLLPLDRGRDRPQRQRGHPGHVGDPDRGWGRIPP